MYALNKILRFSQSQKNNPVVYDMQTKFAQIFNTQGRYQYTTRESIQAIRAYAQSELISAGKEKT